MVEIGRYIAAGVIGVGMIGAFIGFLLFLALALGTIGAFIVGVA